MDTDYVDGQHICAKTAKEYKALSEKYSKRANKWVIGIILSMALAVFSVKKYERESAENPEWRSYSYSQKLDSPYVKLTGGSGIFSCFCAGAFLRNIYRRDRSRDKSSEYDDEN